MARLSVIITTWNRKKLLKKAIESVLNQSEQDFELIVVDDCSIDGTEKIIPKDKRIRYLKTEKNCGTDSQPKNLGIKEAKGEYICFLDDDDIYRSDALKVLSKYIKHSGADIVYADYLIQEGKKLKPGWSIDFDIKTLQKMNYITMITAMVKRSALLEVGGFDENVPRYKDWHLWIRLQKRGYKFLHIPIIIAEVSCQKDSISERYKDKVEYDEQGNYLPTFFNPADTTIYAGKTILSDKKAIKVAIFTLTKDRLAYTQKMYESLKLAGYPFDWFVVDQGSKDGTVEWLDSVNCRKLVNKKNTGIAKGWNTAVDMIRAQGKITGQYDIVIKIDNDAEMMTQGWLKIMIEIFERNRMIVLSPYVEGLEDSPGGVLRQRTSGASPYVLINDKILGVVPFLGGIVWAAPMELYDKFRFEEESFYTGGKDFQISQYARSIGYSLFYLEETRVYHQEGTKGQQKRYPDYFKQREKELKTKYEPRKVG